MSITYGFSRDNARKLLDLARRQDARKLAPVEARHRSIDVYFVLITDTEMEAGRYPGKRHAYQASDGSYIEGNDVWVVAPMGTALVADLYYPAIRAGSANGRPVWVAVEDLAGIATIEGPFVNGSFNASIRGTPVWVYDLRGSITLAEDREFLAVSDGFDVGGSYYIALIPGSGGTLTDTTRWQKAASLTPTAWNNTTDYQAGALVTHTAVTFIATSPNTDEEPVDYPAWDSGDTYAADDVVTHGGKLRISLQNGNTNHEPGATGSEAWWDLATVVWVPLPSGVGTPGMPFDPAETVAIGDVRQAARPIYAIQSSSAINGEIGPDFMLVGGVGIDVDVTDVNEITITNTGGGGGGGDDTTINGEDGPDFTFSGTGSASVAVGSTNQIVINATAYDTQNSGYLTRSTSAPGGVVTVTLGSGLLAPVRIFGSSGSSGYGGRPTGGEILPGFSWDDDPEGSDDWTGWATLRIQELTKGLNVGGPVNDAPDGRLTSTRIAGGYAEINPDNDTLVSAGLSSRRPSSSEIWLRQGIWALDTWADGVVDTSTYMSRTDSNTGNALGSNTNWVPLIGDPADPPAWAAGSYDFGAIVSHASSVWLCNVGSTTDTPGTSGDWLEVTPTDQDRYDAATTYNTGDYVTTGGQGFRRFRVEASIAEAPTLNFLFENPLLDEDIDPSEMPMTGSVPGLDFDDPDTVIMHTFGTVRTMGLDFVSGFFCGGSLTFSGEVWDGDPIPTSLGGVPAGGTTGQVLTKWGDGDFEYGWATP